MSKKRFYIFEGTIRGNFDEVDKPLNKTEIVDLLNEQQATIKKLLMCDEKKVRELELEIRRLQLIIRLQGEIIDSYKELAEVSGGKVVIG